MRAQTSPSFSPAQLRPQKVSKAFQGACTEDSHAWLLQRRVSDATQHARRQVTTVCSLRLGFHQQRLAAEVRNSPKDPSGGVTVQIREAETDADLHAIGMLRARSFYAYPPEREFAGKIHQTMIAEEEYKALKAERARRAKLTYQHLALDRSVCLLARAQPDDKLPEAEGVVGTLDLYAVSSVQGEVLIGNSDNAAYLANVCVAESARRQGVGGALIHEARQRARTWGVDALYVHIMAVNEGAKLFYQLHGFTTEQEETSNQAHYRGHCLDGIEGRGRTMLLRDTLL